MFLAARCLVFMAALDYGTKFSCEIFADEGNREIQGRWRSHGYHLTKSISDMCIPYSKYLACNLPLLCWKAVPVGT
jgi:hypothetical protein